MDNLYNKRIRNLGLLFLFVNGKFYSIYKEGLVLRTIYHLLLLHARRKINTKFTNKEW